MIIGGTPLPRQRYRMGLFDFLGSVLAPDTSASLDVEQHGTAERKTPDRVMTGTVGEPRWRSGLEAVLAAMPDVDDALAEEGEDVYLRMEQDPDIAAALDQIDGRVLGRDMEWTPPAGMEGDPFAIEVAEYVSRVIRGELDLRADLDHLFRAKTRRMEVSQVIWRKGDGRYGEPEGTWVPDRLRPEDGRQYGRTRDGGLYRRTGSRNVLLTPPGRYDRKFVYNAHGHEPRRPQGRSILDRVYWPWKMLRSVEGFWLDCADRFAVPPVVGIMEMIADLSDAGEVERVKELTEQVAASLAPLQSGSTAAFVGKDVKALTASGGFDFNQFADYLIRRIRKGILATTLTVDTNGVGARSHAEEHGDEVDKVAQQYGADLARTVERTLGRWVAEARFGPAARRAFPRAHFDWRQVATFDQYCKAVELGAEPSREALFTVYNVPRPANDEDKLVAPPRGLSGIRTTDPGVSFGDAPFGRAPSR